MDTKEFEKRLLVENSDMLAMLSNQLGRYIQANDIQGFQVLTRAVNNIIEMRQRELTNSMRDKETE